MPVHHLPPVHYLRLPNPARLNAGLIERFLSLRDDPATRRSHFFDGRYENLYMDRESIPEVLPLVDVAEEAARHILGREGGLACGFWFNSMGPGQRTSLHTHEENDELLSAVYYVTAPENSGDLILRTPPATIRVRPAAGLMVLFPPDLPHAVEVNGSGAHRLSIAFNFGPAG